MNSWAFWPLWKKVLAVVILPVIGIIIVLEMMAGGPSGQW